MRSNGQLTLRTSYHAQSAHLVEYDPTSGLALLDSVQLCTTQTHSVSWITTWIYSLTHPLMALKWYACSLLE